MTGLGLFGRLTGHGAGPLATALSGKASGVVTGAFFLLAAAVALVMPVADDEGMLTWMAVTGAAREPLAFLFAQKFRPAGTLINMPVAWFGWQVFLLWHCALAAAAIHLLGRAVDRFGGSGLLAQLVLACSPTYFIGAISGHSNTDGIFFVALALYLWVVRRELVLAGVVLGMTPWVRYEFALFVAVMALLALVRREERRLLIGVVSLPAAWLVAGALYHQDLLWWLHYGPTLASAMPGSRFFDQVAPNIGYMQRVAAMLDQVTLLWLLPVVMPLLSGRARMSPHEKAIGVALGLTFLAMVGLPFVNVLNFEHTPRYLMVILPLVAVAVGRIGRSASSPDTDANHSKSLSLLLAWAVLLVGGAVAAVPALRPSPADMACMSALMAAIVSAAYLLRRQPWAILAIVVLGACGQLFAPLGFARRASVLPARDLAAAVAWIQADPRAAVAPAIYTNDMRLDLLLRLRIPERRTPRHVLYQYDVMFELYHLLNRENGQLDAVTLAMRDTIYGHAVWPIELGRRQDLLGAIFVLRDDYRFDQLYPHAYIDDLATEVGKWGRYRILVGKRASPSTTTAPRLDQPWLRMGEPTSKRVSEAMSLSTSAAADSERTGRYTP